MREIPTWAPDARCTLSDVRIQGEHVLLRRWEAGHTLEGRLRSGFFKDGELVDTWLYARLRTD